MVIKYILLIILSISTITLFLDVTGITEKLKSKFYKNKIVYKFQYGLYYVKEVIRSDGYVLERETITELEYNNYLREKKLERICNGKLES